MKKLMFPLVTFLALMSCSVAHSQITSYKNFMIEDREVVYRLVNDTSVSVDVYVQFLETLSTVKINQVYDDYIIAEFNNLPVDFRRYGYKWGNTPILVQTYDTSGKLRIDFKNDKYRITLQGIKLVNEKETEDLSFYALRNKKDSFRPAYASHDILGIYDRFFADYFKIKSVNNNW